MLGSCATPGTTSLLHHPTPCSSVSQKSLNKLVGSSSGYIESLPKPVQRRIDFIRDIEDERSELEDQYLEEKRALEQKYAKLYGKW